MPRKGHHTGERGENLLRGKSYDETVRVVTYKRIDAAGSFIRLPYKWAATEYNNLSGPGVCIMWSTETLNTTKNTTREIGLERWE